MDYTLDLPTKKSTIEKWYEKRNKMFCHDDRKTCDDKKYTPRYEAGNIEDIIPKYSVFDISSDDETIIDESYDYDNGDYHDVNVLDKIVDGKIIDKDFLSFINKRFDFIRYKNTINFKKCDSKCDFSYNCYFYMTIIRDDIFNFLRKSGEIISSKMFRSFLISIIDKNKDYKLFRNNFCKMMKNLAIEDKNTYNNNIFRSYYNYYINDIIFIFLEKYMKAYGFEYDSENNNIDILYNSIMYNHQYNVYLINPIYQK